MTQIVADPNGKNESTQAFRRAFLERLAASARGGDLLPEGFERSDHRDPSPAGDEWPPSGLGDDRAELVVRQIERLHRAEGLPRHFSVLHVGCRDGWLLAELYRRFPEAECYGVDWPTRLTPAPVGPESSGIELYAVDVDQLFESGRENRWERFDLVLMSGGFDAPGGAESKRAPQWAHAWLGKNVSYVIGVALPGRLRELKELGRAVALESRRDDGQLVCWAGSHRLPVPRRTWSDRLARWLLFLRWFWQNLRRYGPADALYHGGHVLWAVIEGRLPRTALSDPDLRTKFCARLTRSRAIRQKTTYVFVFLGEFGYEVLNWQGVVRKFARRLPASSRIIIAGRKGLEPFYETATQYIEIDGLPEYRDSYAAAYFAMAPDQSRRHLPPTQSQFTYDAKLRRAIEDHVRAKLDDDRRRVEFVFSSQANALDDCIFGADPRFYGIKGYHGEIYAKLDLANNEYARIPTDETVRASVERRLGFGLDEPFVFVQSRRRTIGPQTGGELDDGPLIEELARRCRLVYFTWSSSRHLDSGSGSSFEGVNRYDGSSFLEQSCLIENARHCVLLTEGDLGSHTYLPPLLGKSAVIVAPESVFERRSAPVAFWNRNVFRFGGQMVPLPSESLDSPEAVRETAERILRAPDSLGSSAEAAALPTTKRILFVVHHGHLRDCEHVVEQLAARGHSIQIATALTPRKTHDADALPRLAARSPGITHAPLPALPIGRWDDLTGLCRSLLDYLRYLEPGDESARRLRERARQRAPRSAVFLFEHLPLRRPRVLALMQACLRFVERVAPTRPACEQYVASLRPDLVVFTPLDSDSDSVEYLKSVNELGIPTVLCLASWDNLSNGDVVQVTSDRMVVWNEVPEREAVIELEALMDGKPAATPRKIRPGLAGARLLLSPMTAVAHIYVRHRRRQALAARRREEALEAKAREEALAAKAEAERVKEKALAAKAEAERVKEKALAAKAEAKRAKEEVRAAMPKSNAGAKPKELKREEKALAAKAKANVAKAKAKAANARAEVAKVKPSDRRSHRRARAAGVAEVQRERSTIESRRAMIERRRTNSADSADWAGLFLAQIEEVGLDSKYESLYLWGTPPVPDHQEIITRRVGAGDFETEDPQSRPALIVGKLRELVDDPRSPVDERFRLLDIACGDAVVLWQIKKVFPDAACYGLDCNIGLFATSAAAMEDGVLLYHGYLQHLFARALPEGRKFDVTLMLNTYRGWESADLRESDRDLPEQADAWLARYSRYMIVTATRTQIERLRRQGWYVEELGKGEDDSTMICASRDHREPATSFR